MSHISLTVFALFSSSFATALNYSGVSMGWILEFVGVAVGPAVIPIVLAVNTAHVSPTYMALAAAIGTLCGLVSWIGTAKGMFGEVTVDTLYENWAMFVGCTVGLFIPLVIYGLMYPLHRVPYDWDKLFLMEALEPRPGDKAYTLDDHTDIGDDWDPPALAKASRDANIISAVVSVIFLVIIPFSLYGTGYIMSRGFFTGWTVVVFIWAWIAAGLIWGLPIWQARHTWIAIFRGAMGGRKSPAALEGQAVSATPDDESGVHTEKVLAGEKQSI